MGAKQVSQVEFDAVYEGLDISITYTRTTKWSTDHHYGADADGNRGISVTEIDEDDYSAVQASWEDNSTGNAHNNIPFDEIRFPEMKAEIIKMIEQHMEEHEPVMEEPDEPEWEPEDPDESAWDSQDIEEP